MSAANQPIANRLLANGLLANRCDTMLHRLCVAAVLGLLVASLGAARAADPVAPEKLLAKDSLVYLRYDGIEGHRTGFDKTVLARLMREDLGDLVNYLTQLAQDAAGPEVLSERLLAGATPGKLLTLQKAAKGLPDALGFLYRHGALLGVELIDPLGPRAQATIVFPGAGQTDKYRDGILGAVRFAALATDQDVETKKIEGRSVLVFEHEPVKLAVWQEGDHVVLTVGTEDVAHTLALVEGKRPDLTASERFKQLASFKGYETWMRGYVDIEGGQKIGEKLRPPGIGAIEEKLGINDLVSLSFHSGFEGPYLRQTVLLETRGKRPGLLRILNTPEALALAQLPSLPADVTSFYATRIDWNATFKAGLEAFQEIAKVANPGLAESVPDDLIKEFEKLQSSFRSGLVLFNAPSQGPLSLGFTLALEVKDAEKLKASLETALRKAAAQAGAEYESKVRKYRGVELYTIQPHERAFPFTPTYTVHNGWFVAALNPQPVQAYIMRTTGKDYTRWKPPAVVQQGATSALADGKAKITSLSYADPRPTVELVLNWAPLLAGYAKTFGATQLFDVSLVPNTRSINDLIGPRVTVGVDDGRTMRWERTSTFPLEMSFAEMYGLVALFGAGFSLAGGEKLVAEEIVVEGEAPTIVEEVFALRDRPPQVLRPQSVRRCER
jgi:hypothetical protein